MTNPEPESTAVAVASPNGKGAMVKLLEPRAETLANLLPEGLRVERVIAAAQLAAYQNPDLLKCEPASIFLAVAKAAQCGLEIGTTAHLVPFGRTCTFVADYKGLIEIVRAAKGARSIDAQVVREGDRFEVTMGTNPGIVHEPRYTQGAAITHAYAVAHHGQLIPPQFVVMSAEEIDAIRTAKSKSWKSGKLEPWYAKKTVTRQLCKVLPKNAALAAALAKIDGAELDDAPVDPNALGYDDPRGDGRSRFPTALKPQPDDDYPQGVNVETGEVEE